MKLFESIKNAFSSKDISKLLGKALVKIPSHDQDEEYDFNIRANKMAWFEKAYKDVPLVKAIVDVQAEQIAQDFFWEGPNKIKLSEWSDKVNLLEFFYNISKMKLIFGDGFVEAVLKGEEIIKLKILNSKWMVVYRNKLGGTIGYSQIINDNKMILWGTTGKVDEDRSFKKRYANFDNIIQFKNDCLGSEKYGISVIECIKDSLVSKIDMEKNTGKLLDKYVAPLIWAKVGSDEMPAQTGAVSSVANTLKNLHAESEIATSHLVELQVLDFGKKGFDLKTPLDHIENQIITGGEVPPILLGRGEGANVKAAEVQLRSFGRHVKSAQRKLRVDFEDKIIIGFGLGEFDDKLVWSKAEEREWEMDVDIIRGLVTDGILTPQKANDLLPPRYRETLPDPMEQAQRMAEITGSNNQGIPGEDGPRDSQKKSVKVTDNPTDPTKTIKDESSKGKRVVKTDRKVPLK